MQSKRRQSLLDESEKLSERRRFWSFRLHWADMTDKVPLFPVRWQWRSSGKRLHLMTIRLCIQLSDELMFFLPCRLLGTHRASLAMILENSGWSDSIRRGAKTICSVPAKTWAAYIILAQWLYSILFVGGVKSRSGTSTHPLPWWTLHVPGLLKGQTSATFFTREDQV